LGRYRTPTKIVNRTVCLKIGGIIVGVLLLNLVWFQYVRSEHTIYSWDYDGYWAICGRFEHKCATAPVQFVRDVLGSIRNDEYTAEPVVPAAIAISVGEKLHLFSFSRAAYIMANGTFYLVPALLLLIWLVSALRTSGFNPGIDGIPPSAWLAGAMMGLLTPALWLPLYRGYPDGGGLVFCFLITALFVRWRQQRRGGLDHLLTWSAIVILLVGLVYFRRWYLYWIIWFWIAAGLVCLWDAWEERRRGSRGWGTLRNLAELCSGALAFGALMFAVSPHFVRGLVSYNYPDRYSAFHESKSFGQYLAHTFSAPGVVGILLFVGGLAYAFFKWDLRKFAVFQIVQLGGVVVHFGRTQDFGPHHHYLLLALMLPLATLFVAELLRKFGWIAFACLLPIGVLGYTLSFTSLLPGAPRVLFPLTGAVDGAPMRRGDLAEWRRLGATLDDILRSRGQGTIYVLGNSLTINSSGFQSINRSLNEKFVAPTFVYYSRDIDKRDGFPDDLLRARYVVVSDPIQVQYDTSEQEIIAEPEREFLEGSGIAAAFEKLPVQFVLDGGVKVYIYQKTRGITSQDLRQFCDELRRDYPDRPYIYQPPAGVLDREQRR